MHSCFVCEAQILIFYCVLYTNISFNKISYIYVIFYIFEVLFELVLCLKIALCLDIGVNSY